MNNRKIKFRAYNKEWDMILPVKELKFNDGELVSVVVENETKNGIKHEEWGDYIVGEEIEVTQYTGLKDKNGKEIYEGDILYRNYGKDNSTGEIYKKRGKVQFMSSCGCDSVLMGWGCLDKDGEHIYGDWTEFEIIGNIYENPNLIKNNE